MTRSNQQSWHDRWQDGRIGFHRKNYHAALTKYWQGLTRVNNGAVLVPLCGKSLDMIWLAKQGHPVIGVELSVIAAEDFFAENKITYEVTTFGKFQKYAGADITILVGDFFDLAAADIPNVKAVYDRAALIALPLEMRQSYVRHLQSILTANTQILLITIVYDQMEMDGPPFSVTPEETQSTFETWCDVTTLETLPPEDFRGLEAFESAYGMRVKNKSCRVG